MNFLVKDSAYLFWLNYISKRKLIYAMGTLAVFMCNISQVVLARYMGHLIDFFGSAKVPDIIAGYDRLTTFYIIFGIVLSSRVLLMLGRMGWRIFFGRQTHYANGHLKKKIWQHARYFPNTDLVNNYPKGVLMSVANSDVDQARFIFGFTLIGVIDVIFLGIFTIISMLYINVTLTISSLIALIFLPLFVKKLCLIEIERYDRAQAVLSGFNDLVSQAISTIKLQKLGATAKFWYQKLFEGASQYRESRLIAQQTSLRYIPIMGLSTFVTYLVLFGLGGYFVYLEKITVGEFVALQGLIFLLQDPLVEIGFIISEWSKSMTSLRRLMDIFNNDFESYLLKREGEKFSGDTVYSVDKLNFSFGDNKIFKDLSFVVKKGQRIGITGKIGSGKSTLTNMLCGLERNFTGTLKFYEHEFDFYANNDLRDHIVYIHQKPFLFASSIVENIKMDRDLSDDEIWKFIEMACLDDDIKNFDDGINTYLGEWGINLSGGQKQRLALARALSRKPDVLILDDCLSAVDTVTEERILRNLNSNLKETTMIWVAHRDSTLKYCDKVINLDDINGK